jgi:pantoate--beta-alanine ligase
VRTIEQAREALSPLRSGSIGLVPTMGSLHAGHLSLLRAARAECATVVMSLFVNPAQFAEAGELERYPRDEARDLALAEDAGVDLVFAPSADEMYPTGFQTWVEVTELGSILEGRFRPGHFRGVATVVLKLFTIVRPSHVYFGRKDAQQVAVIRNLLRDLDLAPRIDLRVLPTVRDADGLALSSRNVYLSPEERAQAVALPRALEAGLAAHRAGSDPAAAALAILDAEPALTVDYATVADLDGPTLAAAVHIGRTRLIDNVRLEDEDAAGGG